MIWNDAGLPLGLPVNEAAGQLVREQLARKGGALLYVPVIRGDVVVLEPEERW